MDWIKALVSTLLLLGIPLGMITIFVYAFPLVGKTVGVALSMFLAIIFWKLIPWMLLQGETLNLGFVRWTGRKWRIESLILDYQEKTQHSQEFETALSHMQGQHESISSNMRRYQAEYPEDQLTLRQYEGIANEMSEAITHGEQQLQRTHEGIQAYLEHIKKLRHQYEIAEDINGFNKSVRKLFGGHISLRNLAAYEATMAIQRDLNQAIGSLKQSKIMLARENESGISGLSFIQGIRIPTIDTSHLKKIR